MFDGLISNRFSGKSLEFLDAFEGFTGQTQRFTGVGEAVDPVEPVETSSFGAIASYQVCACCARFHGPTTDADGGPVFGLNADDRGVFGPNGKPSLSSTDAGAQITRTNQSWATALGTAATVTYAFRDSVTTMPTDTTGFSQFNTAQITATQLAMAAWSDVANITFQRVQETGSQYSNNATILLGNYASGQEGAAAFAYLPGTMPGQTAAGQAHGDVWINSSLSYNALPVQQGYGQLTLLHEIGHAIGLSHPAAYNASATGTVTYGASAIYYEDSLQYSVMSYFSEVNTGADFRINGQGVRAYSSAPLLDDISAAQRLYGANMSTRTGDTIYGFNSNAGQPWFTASFVGAPLVFCAWDAGGSDTFDFSGYAMAQVIDLRQGSFSNVGGMIGNVSIALGAVIENAIGGAGSDTFRGNSANNRFTPNAGADFVDGGLGTDTVVFSGARASYTVTWDGQTGRVIGNGQTVTVTNVEFLQFTDQTIAAAPTGGLVVGGDITNETINGTALGDVIGGLGGADTINGLAGNDTLNGGSGDDTLNGGDGDDVLVGASGNDTLNGGAGSDTADYSGAGAEVTINLANGTATGGGGADTLVQIENVTGSAFADTLTGDGNANIIRGGGGIDTIHGGGGADQLFAGAPGEGGGAPDIVKGISTANGSIAAAVSLTGAFDLRTDPAIGSSNTTPHATVVATTHGGLEYYAITVVAGETVVFDIDNASFDSTLRLFNAGGAELANNDDNAEVGTPATDSALTHTFATAGTYYIQVARWLTNPDATTFTSGPPPAGQTYTLHVSSPSQTPVPITWIGSTLNGDAGADTLTGGSGIDTLNGGADDDILNGMGGSDTLNGGDGTDTAIYVGMRSAYTISVSGGVTTIAGPDGTDTVTNVERLQFSDMVTNAAGEPVGGPINGTAGADTLNGTAGADTINGLDGDDVINGAAGNDTIDGGAGADTAVFSGTMAGSTVTTNGAVTTVAGPDGTDTLTGVEYLRFTDGTLIVGAGGGQLFQGTAGNDTLTGTAFADDIRGGAGDDTLVGGAGADILNGGDGVDTVDYSSASARIAVYLTEGTVFGGVEAQGDTLSGVENVIGTNSIYTDYLTGNAGANTLSGLAGDDELRGLGGNDILIGGAGADFLDGGAGDDTLVGGIGADTLVGGDGVDTVDYSSAPDRISVYLTEGLAFGGVDAQGDTLSGIENVIGTNSIYTDYLTGNSGANTLSGLAGDDELRGLGGDDILIGGEGADLLDGGAGDDTLDGGIGADRLFGGSGADIINGGAGDDTLVGGIGADTLVGGDGVDTVDYSSAPDRISVYLTEGLAFGGVDAQGDTLSGIENVIGTNSIYTDYLTGNAGANTLSGLAGDDELRGLGGNDILLGGAGADFIDGGAGDDTLEGGIGNDALVGGAGADFLDGGAGDDTLVGGVGADTFVGGDGVDTVDYSSAPERISVYLTEGLAFGGVDAQGDTLSGIENVIGTNSIYTDYLTGNAGANTLSGLAGDDELRGLGGNDILIGGAGADFLDGGAGDDTLVGGIGADTLVGGDGVDTVDYSSAPDRISVYLTEGLAFGGVDAQGDTLSGIENVIGTNSIYTDYLTGNAGANTLSGLAGDDELRGLGGNDILIGGAGADFLDGGAGDDTLVGGIGADTLVGGDGVDTVDYSSAPDRISVYLTEGLAFGGVDAQGDTLSGIENVIGTNSIHTDFLTGNSGANRLSGLAGDDELRGLDGDDVLVGGAGNDLIQGGAGNDTAVYSGNRSAYTVSVLNGVTTVSGPDGVDTVTGVEWLQFADMLTDAAGAPMAIPASGAEAPWVSPALADDKTGGGLEILPTAPADMAKDSGPEVLPAAPDSIVKESGPQVLPGAEQTWTPGRGGTSALDQPLRDGDIAVTISRFDDSALDNDALYVPAVDGDAPEVLPVMDDDFVLTGKFDGPPVMPTLETDFDGTRFVRDMDLVRDLLFAGNDGRTGVLDLQVHPDDATPYDGWSGLLSSTRNDFLG